MLQNKLTTQHVHVYIILFFLIIAAKSDFVTQRALDRRPTMERILLHSSPSLPGDMANPRNSLLLQRKLNLFKDTEEKKKRGGKDKVKKASIYVHGNL